MIENEVSLRVRYAETDQMGYVYYGNYATYFEVARVETFRAIGFSYKELEAEGVGMPVVEYKTRYLKPARYDDLLTIKVFIRQLPSVKIIFEYEVYNQEGVLLNTAETTLVFFDMVNGKVRTLPDFFQNILQSYFNK